jgi:hypothetical protein
VGSQRILQDAQRVSAAQRVALSAGWVVGAEAVGLAARVTGDRACVLAKLRERLAGVRDDAQVRPVGLREGGARDNGVDDDDGGDRGAAPKERSMHLCHSLPRGVDLGWPRGQVSWLPGSRLRAFPGTLGRPQWLAAWALRRRAARSQWRDRAGFSPDFP